MTDKVFADGQILHDNGDGTFSRVFYLGGSGMDTVPVGHLLTRPADAIAYAAQDTISSSTTAPAVQSFTAGRMAGGSGYITGLRAMTDLETMTARLRVHVYHTSVTPPNDNTKFGLLWANRASRLGYIDLPAFAAEDTGVGDAAESQNFDIRIPFKCDAASQLLYYIVETLDVFTPGNAQNIYFEFSLERN